MTIDFHAPNLSLTEADYAQAIRDMAGLLATMLDSTGAGGTNLPTLAKRWNAAATYWEQYNGTTWAALASKYMIDVDTLDGKHASDLALAEHNHSFTYQALHANLTALAGLSLVANKLAYANGTGTLALTGLTAFARTLLDDADAAAMRSTLGLVLGTNVQASHGNLTALAGLSLIADRLPYANGTGTLSLATLTAAGRALLDDVDAAAQRSTLGLGGSATKNVGEAGGVQAYAANLAALAGLTGAAAKGIRFTGAGGMEVFTLSDFAKTFLDDADAAAVKATLGISSGGEWEQVGFTNVTTPVASVNFTGLSANSYDYRITAQNVVPSSISQWVYAFPACGPGSIGYVYGSLHLAPTTWSVVSQAIGSYPVAGHYGNNFHTGGGRNFNLMLRYVGLPGTYPVYEVEFDNTAVQNGVPTGAAEAHYFDKGSNRFTYYAAEVPNFGMFFAAGNINSGIFKLYRRPRL